MLMFIVDLCLLLRDIVDAIKAHPDAALNAIKSVFRSSSPARLPTLAASTVSCFYVLRMLPIENMSEYLTMPLWQLWYDMTLGYGRNVPTRTWFLNNVSAETVLRMMEKARFDFSGYFQGGVTNANLQLLLEKQFDLTEEHRTAEATEELYAWFDTIKNNPALYEEAATFQLLSATVALFLLMARGPSQRVVESRPMGPMEANALRRKVRESMQQVYDMEFDGVDFETMRLLQDLRDATIDMLAGTSTLRQAAKDIAAFISICDYTDTYSELPPADSELGKKLAEMRERYFPSVSPAAAPARRASRSPARRRP